uniref:Nucleolar protein 12 n=1 Tax=Naja naja TaxID=35670 RepID=A0A8C7DUS4_NAJNA
MKEERHKEYMKMLKEREEALEEADELEHLVTSQTESVSYDHPNHTVTVTTISDLDLSGARVLGLTEVIYLSFIHLFTKKQSLFSSLIHRISSLTASLHSRTQKKRKRKQINHKQGIKNRGQKTRTGRTSKSQRRKMTGRKRQVQD